MSTINTSTYTSYSASTASSKNVTSFQKEAEELMKDQVSIGKGGTYDTYVSSTDTEFSDPNATTMSGIYTDAMGNTKGVTYDENGGVESVDTTQLQYNRMADHQNMISVMMGQKPQASSIADMFTSILSASSSSANSGVATALTTDDGAYSVDSVSENILGMAEKIAGDDLEVLAELKDAFVKAYEEAGDSSSALSKDTYTKVLSGFNTIESNINARLEESTDVETDTDVEVETEAE